MHKVISDQILKLGLSSFYTVEKGHIYGKRLPNGQQTIFSFEGIKNNTDRIRSYEGIDYCWAEEAAKISSDSWRVLLPTIRKASCPQGHEQPAVDFTSVGDDWEPPTKCPACGSLIAQSEIWMTFNPELDTDYTYTRFVLGANPETTSVVKMDWRDNPWFPITSYNEMMEDKKRDYDMYLNVWEGHCRQLLEGAVYAKEIRRCIAEGRIAKVPWEREWPVDTFWDLGSANATAIWFAQRVAMQYRVLDFYSASGEDITHFIRELQRREYLYNCHWLPHDAKAKRLGSKRTIEEQLRQHYPGGVRIVPKLSIEDGINAARLIFPNVWFDEIRCKEGLRALRSYRYEIVDEGNQRYSERPVHDWASDAADAFRYMAISLQQRKISGPSPEKLKRPPNSWIAEGLANLGWMS